MSYRKLFLVFVLAFAALTLGRSQEATAQWDWDWGDLPPGFIDGGSTVLVYTCSQGTGTNTLTLGDPDIFNSHGQVSCNFTGQVKANNVPCTYDLTFTGDLVSCNDNNGAGPAVVTVRSTCDNVNGVSGTLSCSGGIIDNLGISSKNECQKAFPTGKNTNTLFTQATYVGQTCSQVLTTATNAGLKFGGLTKTQTNVCHSDGPGPVDCITSGGGKNTSTSEIPNLVEVACVASPQTWNVDCTAGSGTKDQGNGRVCYVNGGVSFDPTKLAAGTATLNGVPVDETKQGKPLCQIKDCNGDGVLDFECTFPTCSGGNPTAAPPLAAELGELTMITSFQSTTGDISGLTCTTPVATSGQLP